MLFLSAQAIKIIYAKKDKQLSLLSQGFTLVELLVVLVITSVLVTGATIGLQTLLQASFKSEQKSQVRYKMNRAVDYITNDIKTANQLWDDDNTDGASVPGYQDSSGNEWSKESEWLNNSSHNPVLYIRSPLRVNQIDTSNDQIEIDEHRFLSGHAVVFTGDGVGSLTNINEDQIYYVLNAQENSFEVASSPGGTAINLDNNPTDITANRLIVYYTRDNTSTWYGPNTLNRSAGICSYSSTTNCPTLIDAVQSFNINNNNIANGREVDLTLTGVLNPRDVANLDASPKTEKLEFTGFARSSNL